MTGVHFDLRGQARLGERVFQGGLIVGRLLIVICRDRDEELRLALRGPRCGSWRIGTSLRHGRGDGADTIGTAAAVRNAIGPPMQ